MYRKIYNYLKKWKEGKYRKPLIIQGARQVGKTFAVLEFGKENYTNVAYFNFQTNPVLSQTFNEDISPEYLIPLLSHIGNQPILPAQTLIVFDEVQLCERALTALKYFCELAPQYHIIAAGSLLGVAVNRERYAFPVGKVDRFTLYPMDIEEFFIAVEETDLINRIKNCYENSIAMPEVLHKKCIDIYRKYLFIGGMPEAVDRYIETGDFVQVRHVQDTINMSYLDDMSKYQESSSEIAKTRLTYDTISVQLSKKNTRFQYKLIKKGGRASAFENSIQWLIASNLIHRINRLEQVFKPLNNYIDIDDFKVYISDTGLLCAQKKLRPGDILYMPNEMDDFKGGMIENYVNIQLTINGFQTFYFRNDNGTKEIDFILDIDGNTIPMEVKSGINTTSASLKWYVEKYAPKYSIRVSESNFGFENGIRSIPLYSLFCLKNERG